MYHSSGATLVRLERRNPSGAGAGGTEIERNSSIHLLTNEPLFSTHWQIIAGEFQQCHITAGFVTVSHHSLQGGLWKCRITTGVVTVSHHSLQGGIVKVSHHYRGCDSVTSLTARRDCESVASLQGLWQCHITHCKEGLWKCRITTGVVTVPHHCRWL